MEEPIKYFHSSRGFDRGDIKSWAIGEKYVAIMNKTGNIGVCSTLGTKMNDSIILQGEADPDDPVHRIILNAYYNSIYNYERNYKDIRDIFDSIDFSKYSKIVMIGYFESLYDKFQNKGIALEVFDIHKESHILSDISGLETSLSDAEAVILSGTTIFNNTFNKITGLSPGDIHTFLLGPSNILSEEMFGYPGIKVVFGSVFNPGDSRVLDCIAGGSGTRGFLPYLQKVYIVKNDFRDELR
ncbi:MAG: hypothetical protein KFF49_07215 [Bacteroidales bacterium]|nr:hypothetical protein [Bacteroidales bacterium]